MRLDVLAISGAVSASFQYDPFGRRVSKTIGGTTQFLYDGANPVQEISGSSASANLLTGGVDEYFQRTDSAGTRKFLTDALGSTLALADSTGALQTQYTFEPFGNTSVTGAATTNSFAYTGRELDSTGLYFHRARYYSPQLQRFISEDPLGFSGGVNIYAYVENDPINNTDTSGLCSDRGGVGTRYCAEAYIPQSSAWAGPIPFGGDNRGPQSNRGSYRFHLDYGSNGPHCKPGTSTLFFILDASAQMSYCQVIPRTSGRKDRKSFRFRAGGGDGWGFGAAPLARFDVSITETDSGVYVVGFATDYPNVEVWQYSDDGTPTLVFATGTDWGPSTGPISLIPPNPMAPYGPFSVAIPPH
jgi:RHS repeat-associated protein